MNGPSTSPTPPAASPAVRTDWSSISAVLYLWIPACLLAFLLGVVPYGMGYGFEKVPLAYLMEELWKLPDWEHCFLVPLAVAFIIYEMRDKLAVLRPQPSAWGYPMVIVGLLFFWAGERVDNQYIGYASVQWLIGSWIVLTLGWDFFRQLAFPWMFLVFLWPLLFLETYLAFPLRMIMSEASVTVLNVIGIPAVKSGTSILSAADPETGKAVGQAFSVDVADPCSGIRSLFALMMVSALYGFFCVQGVVEARCDFSVFDSAGGGGEYFPDCSAHGGDVDVRIGVCNRWRVGRSLDIPHGGRLLCFCGGTGRDAWHWVAF